MDAESESLGSLIRPQHTDLIRKFHNGRDIIIVHTSGKGERTTPRRVRRSAIIDNDLIGGVVFSGEPHTASGINLNRGNLAATKGKRRRRGSGCPQLIISSIVFSRDKLCARAII